MYTRGEYRDKNGTYGVIMSHTKQKTEIILVTSGQVSSAFKTENNEDFSFLNTKAKELYAIIKTGLAGCRAKNGQPVSFVLGSSVIHTFTKSKVEYCIELFSNEIVSADIQSENIVVKLGYCENGETLIPPGIPYTKLTRRTQKVEDIEDGDEDALNAVQVRTVQEIALEKEDISWLRKKKYFIVNDDETAEKIFSYLDNYNGIIAYDTETTGLRINCFGKINSSYKKTLEQYNAEHPKDQIRADRLVGIIFCVEVDTSYYFPVFNRKFKNLYDTDTPTRRKIIQDIKARYTIGEFANKQSDMADYIRNTPAEEWGSDVILMERVRNILSTKHIVAHNGAFEWKVGWQYEIDTNLRDDTMLLHQIMYKFRSTTSNRGEPSNLKYLAKRELGVDQWELTDFFPDFKEQEGEVRGKTGKKKKKSGSKIDFSYMDYEGTRVYAPTDGDVTLGLLLLYKKDMKENHKNQEYIYNVEVIVACAIAYMEFYGHRIDEEKIAAVRDQSKAKMAVIESEIRQMVGYANEAEIDAFNELKKSMDVFSTVDKTGTKEEREQANEETLKAIEKLYAIIEANEEHPLNLGSPSQVAELFYDVLQIPFSGEKKSVAKKEVKALLKAKDEEGNPKYPVVHKYSEYKKIDTLLTKFFDNLPYYMYPGGLIFSSFGQISTATGRMSCSKPNAQQYPKDVTGIVVPRPGFVMMDADYSQIEYRVLTALAGNEGLAKLFSDPDSDYHTLMASMMYGVPYASVTPKQRSDAKSFNFGIPYGMGLGSLAILLTGMNNATTRAEAAEKYEKYFENQPKTRKFFDQVKEMALINKYTKTFWSRYRYYSFTDADGNENSARKASALRQAGNAVIQGCLHGDTLISTKDFGTVKIKELAGQSTEVWNGSDWVHGDVVYSGKKQKCIVTFTNGQKFICSPNHRFLICMFTYAHVSDINPNYEEDLQNDGYFGAGFVRCKDLKSGAVIEINKDESKCVIDDFDNCKHTINCIEDDDDFMHEYSMDDYPCIIVDSVEITDEYIDMYDVCNTDGGYYVADGIITHNTAADIFKISVARNFMYIRENNLLGVLLIINMIHDEQLFEVDISKVNMQRILRDVGINMQFKVEGFPPLYIGAGIGPAWAKAKGKMAEIHPMLLEQLSREADNIPLWHSPGESKTPEEVLKYFADRVLQFRKEKVKSYIIDQENWGKDLHPAIGNLLNLQFSYGHDKDKEGLSDNEFTQLCLDEFIKHEGIEGVTSDKFKTDIEQVKEVEEDKEYSDGDEEDELDGDEGDVTTTFALIDEDDVVYGATIHDIIKQFNLFVSKSQKVCGVNLGVFNYKQKEDIITFLSDHVCDENAPGAMEIVFLQEANILNRTGVFVNNIDGSAMEARMRKMGVAI